MWFENELINNFFKGIGLPQNIEYKTILMKHKNVSENIVTYVLELNSKELSNLTRYQIAKKFNINISYLSERFKKDTNMSVLHFIEFEKMMRAERLIKTRSDLSIESISHILGFAKTEQFREKFKKYFVLKPCQYRKLRKKRQIGGY